MSQVPASVRQWLIVVAGMMMPPMLGADYTREFSALYPELAKKYSATLIPFLLAGVDGKTSSRQLIEHNLGGTVNMLEFCKTHENGGMYRLKSV